MEDVAGAHSVEGDEERGEEEPEDSPFFDVDVAPVVVLGGEPVASFLGEGVLALWIVSGGEAGVTCDAIAIGAATVAVAAAAASVTACIDELQIADSL